MAQSRDGSGVHAGQETQDQSAGLEATDTFSTDEDPARTPRIKEHSGRVAKTEGQTRPEDSDYFGSITADRKLSSGFLASLTSSNTSSPLQSTYASSASLQSSSEHASGEINASDTAEAASSLGHVASGTAFSLHYNTLTHNQSQQTVVPAPQTEEPLYPDQSLTALHAQTATLPYSYLKARNSDYTSKQPSTISLERSSDRPSPASQSISADHTPLQSPGLFQSRKRGADRGTGQGKGPSLLHPTHHARVTKETNKLIKDFDSVTGNKIMNDYEVHEKLGVGSHGAVKRARNLTNDEFVAIKIVRRYGKKGRLGRYESPEDKVRKEVAVLKKARHPHVVSLLEVIDDPDAQKVYLVLEFVKLGEIIWRTETSKDVASFESRRVNRERSGSVDEAHEAELVSLFNHRVERARIVAQLAKQAHERNSAEAALADTRSKVGEDEYHLQRSPTVDHPDPSICSSETGFAHDNDHAWSNENGGNESDDECARARALHSPVRLRRPGSPSVLAIPTPSECNLFSASEFGPVPETPASLIGSQYGPYSGDDKSAASSEFDLLRPLHPMVQEEWTAEESTYKFVPCMTMSQARDAFRDTVLGLEYLHYQGIIHRDIKPANLLWTEDYRVKISDFGVSHIGKPIRDNEESEDNAADTDEEYELAKTVGTPAFYAPELCDPEWFSSESSKVRPRVTGQIDVWALGVSLYAMIYGRLPFFDETDEFAMYEKIARQEAFLSARRLRGVDENGKLTNSNKRCPELLDYEEVDDTLRDLLKRLLVKDPAKRATLKEVKRHPWTLYGLANPEAWVDETDPSRHSEGKKIEVSNKDVDYALAPLNLVDRLKSGLKRMTSVVRGRDSRRRAESSAKETSGSNSSRSATLEREARRPSLRGDEQIFSALKASREASDHPLSYSVMASPVAEKNEPFSFVRPISHIQFPSSAAYNTLSPKNRPTTERTDSTSESIRTIKAGHKAEAKASSNPPTISEDGQSTARTDSAASSSSAISALLGIASRRLANTMRSKDRGNASKDNSSTSSRSSSAEDIAGSLDDPHAFPSIGLSPAMAAGLVDHSLLAPEAAPAPPAWAQYSPRESRVPEQSSPASYARAEQQNNRRQLSEYEQQPLNPPRSPTRATGAPISPCPPSPDDIAFLASASGSSAEHLGSVGASSVDHMGLSESYSNPSIPSTTPSVTHGDGGASMLATAETIRALDGALHKSITTQTVPPNAAGVLAKADSTTDAKHRQQEDDEAGYHGDGDSDGDDDDDDDGIVMMVARR